MRVVSVDYRQGHEHTFPAASEDVAAVYQALLDRYPPSNVGIYGCSAGGALSAQATAWFLDKGIPTPGAIGIFGSGAGSGSGDSRYFSAIASGAAPPPANEPPAPSRGGHFGYFSNISQNDSLVYPIKDPELLAKTSRIPTITNHRHPRHGHESRDRDTSRAYAVRRRDVTSGLRWFGALLHLPARPPRSAGCERHHRPLLRSPPGPVERVVSRPPERTYVDRASCADAARRPFGCTRKIGSGAPLCADCAASLAVNQPLQPSADAIATQRPSRRPLARPATPG